MLNASRHHGKGDLRRWFQELPQYQGVLNASRHHGKGDDVLRSPRGASLQVLNASRHHGKGDRRRRTMAGEPF